MYMSSCRDVGGLFAEIETDPILLPPADRLPVVFPSPGPQPRFLREKPPHTAGFVELGPLPERHEGPPACHPNTLLINSILIQLSPGSSQESPVKRGGAAQSAVVLSLPPTFPSHSHTHLKASLCQLLCSLSNSMSNNSACEARIGYSAWEWLGAVKGFLSKVLIDVALLIPLLARSRSLSPPVPLSSASFFHLFFHSPSYASL